MSKAFTREDDTSDLPPARPRIPLPPGVKNYLTREGADNLRRELENLQKSRSEAAAANDRSRAQALDQRIAVTQEILASATVVDPAPTEGNQVRFGVYVSVKYPSGDVETFRIVGVDEIDLDRNRISWQSPLARALMNSRAGDVVQFNAPAGAQRLQILAVSHEPV